MYLVFGSFLEYCGTKLHRPKRFSDGLRLNQQIKNRFPELSQASDIYPMDLPKGRPKVKK
jgi:hypothetical protein